MRKIRIFQDCKLISGKDLSLSEDAVQHLAVVLRKKPGDAVVLFNGDNREYCAIIQSVDKKKIVVEIGESYESDKESPCSIHLAQALSKGERMEIVIQKAIELGVTAITPVITEHCVVRLDKARQEKKVAQWRAIAIAACEQCGRNQLPIINPIVELKTFMTNNHSSLNFVLSPNAHKSWRDYSASKTISLVIGPEGGLSESELSLLIKHEFHPLSLGPRIMRTETAAIAAISVLQANYGDL